MGTYETPKKPTIQLFALDRIVQWFKKKKMRSKIYLPKLGLIKATHLGETQDRPGFCLNSIALEQRLALITVLLKNKWIIVKNT